MQDSILEIKNLQVEFLVKGAPVVAVEDISFSVRKGKTLCIVGESGCGKSVTATSIMRLYDKRFSRISKGSILFEGKDLVQCTDEEMRNIRGSRISMIFQDPMTSLNPVYRIGDQMTEMILAHRRIPKKAAWAEAVSMLEKVNIPDAARRMKEYPHQFSGGMRQRVMIAMALSCNPSLLIADEPTTALDVTIQAQILDLLHQLQEQYGTSIILITHDMGVVAEVADDAVVMYAGKIVECNTGTSLFQKPMHPYTQGLLASIPRPDVRAASLNTIEGTVPSLRNMPSGCRFAGRCKYCKDFCKAKEPPLLDAGGGKVRCWKYTAEWGEAQ